MSLVPTVTPARRQRLATVHAFPVAKPPDGTATVIRRSPAAPTYDVQLLNDGLAVAKQIVRELTYHATEAELNPGRRLADVREQQTRQRALALAREVLSIRPTRPY